MKLTLTIALTFIVSVGMAQIPIKKQKIDLKNKYGWGTVSKDTSSDYIKGGFWRGDMRSQATTQNFVISPSLVSITNTWIVVGNGMDKPMLSFDRYPAQQTKPIESITIHVKRLNTVWLNDSTLVVKP